MSKKLYKREWLNSKEGTAFLESAVSIDYNAVYANLSIADCNRKVNLDFSYGKANYKERLNKVDKLLKHLNTFRDSMIEHRDYLK